MKVNYKGFEISVEREESLAGYELLYFYVMRKSDGYFLLDNFEDSADTVKEKVKDIKNVIDDYLKHPEDYEDDDFGLEGVIEDDKEIPCEIVEIETTNNPKFLGWYGGQYEDIGLFETKKDAERGICPNNRLHKLFKIYNGKKIEITVKILEN